MSNIDVYRTIYQEGKRTGLFKSISDRNQNLQVADFYNPPGTIDVHLTYNPNPININEKNLHMTVRYRGLYSDDVRRINEINIRNKAYSKPKEAASFSFYLKVIQIGGHQRLELLNKNDPQLKDIKVDVQGYIDRINNLRF